MSKDRSNRHDLRPVRYRPAREPNKGHGDRRNRMLLGFVGDIGLIGGVQRRIIEYGVEWPFAEVQHVLDTCHILFGNLEMPFCPPGVEKAFAEGCESFRVPPECGPALKRAGFNILSVANNHIMDFGSPGLECTLEVLREHGISAVGAGTNLAQARQPVVLQHGDLNVGFLAYAMEGPHEAGSADAGAAPLKTEFVSEDVGRLREQADIVVVSIHFGMIYSGHPLEKDMQLACSAIDSGADIVVGHHAHVLQGVETYKNGIIAYGLGEFIFDPTVGNVYANIAREERRQSVILRISAGHGAVGIYDTVPLRSNKNLQPVLVRGSQGDTILTRLRQLSGDLPLIHEGKKQFLRSMGVSFVPYYAQVYWLHLKRMHLRFLLSRILRLRARHLWLFTGFMLAKIRAFRRTR